MSVVDINRPGRENYHRAQRHEPDPATVAFLDSHNATVRERDDYRQQCERLTIELEMAENKIGLLEHFIEAARSEYRREIDRLTRERDDAYRGYSNLKLSIGALKTAVDGVLTAGERELLRDGLDPEPRLDEASEHGLRGVAAAFSPDPSPEEIR